MRPLWPVSLSIWVSTSHCICAMTAASHAQSDSTSARTVLNYLRSMLTQRWKQSPLLFVKSSVTTGRRSLNIFTTCCDGLKYRSFSTLICISRVMSYG